MTSVFTLMGGAAQGLPAQQVEWQRRADAFSPGSQHSQPPGREVASDPGSTGASWSVARVCAPAGLPPSRLRRQSAWQCWTECW